MNLAILQSRVWTNVNIQMFIYLRHLFNVHNQQKPIVMREL